jgi:hypothetical protein
MMFKDVLRIRVNHEWTPTPEVFRILDGRPQGYHYPLGHWSLSFEASTLHSRLDAIPGQLLDGAWWLLRQPPKHPSMGTTGTLLTGPPAKNRPGCHTKQECGAVNAPTVAERLQIRIRSLSGRCQSPDQRGMGTGKVHVVTLSQKNRLVKPSPNRE